MAAPSVWARVEGCGRRRRGRIAVHHCRCSTHAALGPHSPRKLARCACARSGRPSSIRELLPRSWTRSARLRARRGARRQSGSRRRVAWQSCGRRSARFLSRPWCNASRVRLARMAPGSCVCVCAGSVLAGAARPRPAWNPALAPAPPPRSPSNSPPGGAGKRGSRSAPKRYDQRRGRRARGRRCGALMGLWARLRAPARPGHASLCPGARDLPACNHARRAPPVPPPAWCGGMRYCAVAAPASRRSPRCGRGAGGRATDTPAVLHLQPDTALLLALLLPGCWCDRTPDRDAFACATSRAALARTGAGLPRHPCSYMPSAMLAVFASGAGGSSSMRRRRRQYQCPLARGPQHGYTIGSGPVQTGRNEAAVNTLPPTIAEQPQLATCLTLRVGHVVVHALFRC